MSGGLDASERPIVVRQISWPMALVQLAALAGIVGAAWLVLRSRDALVVGAMIYLVYSMGSRAILLRDFKNGLRLCASGENERAITEFERSASFFARHAWVDRYRAIAMMSPSRPSYHEMALVNIAACYARMDDIARSKEYLRRALAEHPESAMAKQSLQLIESVERSAVPASD